MTRVNNSKVCLVSSLPICQVLLWPRCKLKSRGSYGSTVGLLLRPGVWKHKIRGLIYRKRSYNRFDWKNPHRSQYFFFLEDLGKQVAALLRSWAWCAQLWNSRVIEYARAHGAKKQDRLYDNNYYFYILTPLLFLTGHLKWDCVTFERRNNTIFLLQMKSLIHKQ